MAAGDRAIGQFADEIAEHDLVPWVAHREIAADGKGGYIVSGSFDLDRVSDLFDSFRPEEEIESTTVGGLVTEWLGRISTRPAVAIPPDPRPA